MMVNETSTILLSVIPLFGILFMCLFWPFIAAILYALAIRIMHGKQPNPHPRQETRDGE